MITCDDDPDCIIILYEDFLDFVLEVTEIFDEAKIAYKKAHAEGFRKLSLAMRIIERTVGCKAHYNGHDLFTLRFNDVNELLGFQIKYGHLLPNNSFKKSSL